MSDALAFTESGLTERDAALLAFEESWWSAGSSKEAALLEQFGLSSPRYYQELNALIDRPEALAHKPVLVRRLRRMRESRQAKRSARPLGVRSTV